MKFDRNVNIYVLQRAFKIVQVCCQGKKKFRSFSSCVKLDRNVNIYILQQTFKIVEICCQGKEIVQKFHKLHKISSRIKYSEPWQHKTSYF